MLPSSTFAPLSGTYWVDRARSSFGFAMRHMSVATLHGSFSDVEASVAVAEDGALSLSGTAQVRSISIVSPAEFRDHVLGVDFLDVKRHPVIVFRSAPTPFGEDGSIAVDGLLTIRNVTRAVVATGTWSASVEDPYATRRAAVELTTSVDRRDYGMTWNAALADGGDVLGTEVSVTVQLELVGG